MLLVRAAAAAAVAAGLGVGRTRALALWLPLPPALLPVGPALLAALRLPRLPAPLRPFLAARLPLAALQVAGARGGAGSLYISSRRCRLACFAAPAAVPLCPPIPLLVSLCSSAAAAGSVAAAPCRALPVLLPLSPLAGALVASIRSAAAGPISRRRLLLALALPSGACTGS